jgi:hypothetical protein
MLLRSPDTIRARSQNVLKAGVAGALTHFDVALEKLEEVAARVAEVTRRRYPTLSVPPHSRFGHFDAGGIARLAALEAELAQLGREERARALCDLVVVSVLLDAGAGMAWRYREASTGMLLGRSEGLAVASLDWARSGALSSRSQPYAVDAQGLLRLDEGALERAFQVSGQNPLVGILGRLHLLRALGKVLESRRDIFGEAARVGGLIDHLAQHAEEGAISAASILLAVLDGLSAIWPGRLSLDGVSLGDVWQHPHAGGEGSTAGLIPFHKLSQWLSYSLIHPVEAFGLSVTGLSALTGLAEYRNGGLFVDAGVLIPKHAEVLRDAHDASSEVIVEWRALTVALLDELAPHVRVALGRRPDDDATLPLAAILEGGTWMAGRELAAERRDDGGSPIRVISDGTVF